MPDNLPSTIFGGLYSSPFGPISLRATDTHVLSLHFGDLGLRDSTPLLSEAEAQLAAYFSGKLRQFRLPLLTKGTDFQQRVWSCLLTIPYGETISYRELAERVGSPRAFRAVGNANGKNPLPVLIPCHRVIASDGSLGGYSYGLDLKQELVRLEHIESVALVNRA